MKIVTILSLLLLCFLASCATDNQQIEENDSGKQNQGRIVRQTLMPVTFSEMPGSSQFTRKSFQQQGIQGWLSITGAWHIEAEVHHGRMLCANYKTGIQLGKGNPSCTNVEWLSNVSYATPLRHCNNASRIHVGGSEFTNAAQLFDEVSCVRIVVHCEGHC